MRSDKALMTSRREFLSNAVGIALVPASTWPIRADQARSMHEQSDSRSSNSGRTTQNMSLRWDVFLALSIPAITNDLPPGEKQGRGRRFLQRLFLGSATPSWSTRLLPSSRRAPWRIGLWRAERI